jgi:hypothetical protein
MTLEPTDKLDAVPRADGDAAMVNGPEDELLDWSQIDWDAAEGQVRRLRQRIFTASQAGDLAKVRNLQKLMLRSHANTLVSVRRVAQLNAGRKTAGIDGKTALLPQEKTELVAWVQQESTSWTARAVKRCSSPSRAGNSDHSEYPCWLIGPCRPGWSTHWNPSGRRGSSRDPTDSGRAVAAMTRSKRSTGPAKASARSGCGFWTRIWRRRSTASITTLCSTKSGPFPLREWSPSG